MNPIFATEIVPDRKDSTNPQMTLDLFTNFNVSVYRIGLEDYMVQQTVLSSIC